MCVYHYHEMSLSRFSVHNTSYRLWYFCLRTKALALSNTNTNTLVLSMCLEVEASWVNFSLSCLSHTDLPYTIPLMLHSKSTEGYSYRWKLLALNMTSRSIEDCSWRAHMITIVSRCMKTDEYLCLSWPWWSWVVSDSLLSSLLVQPVWVLASI